MANNNNINIGSLGTGNTLNITQQQTPTTQHHTEYSVIESSIQRLTKSQVDKGAFRFWISALFPFLAIVADALGVLSYLGIQSFLVFVIIVPAAFLGAALNNESRKIAEHEFKNDEAWFINGQWVEQDKEGNYVVYKKSAPCIYPKCAGTVSIVPAPPREQGNHTLVGICNLGERRHTYTVDYNGIGHPAQFDWRPIEKDRP